MAAEQQPNFFSWLVGLFMGGNDPEKEKRRLLKQVGKDLSKLRYKFYKPAGEMALPQLAKFFYEIYKSVAAASSLMGGADTSEALKEITIDRCLSEEQRKLRDNFTESSIREQAKALPPESLAAKFKNDMVAFISSFDSTLVKRINTLYNVILRFNNFVRFDYYFLLKKFDSTLAESEIASNPKFEAINADYIGDDLKDFMDVAIPIDRDMEWDLVFDILQTYKGVEVVNRQAWPKLTQIIKNIVHSEILVLIIRHITKDPYYKPKPVVPAERIIEGYLSKIKATTEQSLQKIALERRNAKMDKLVSLIFGGPVMPRIKNYTDKANMAFGRKIGTEFLHTDAMNYLKAFLLDFFKKDVRELSDLLIVRGKWTTNVLSQQMSDYYYHVLGVAENVVEFDDSLGEEGELGSKLKRLVGRIIDRDESTAKPVRTMLDEINAKALKIIGEAASTLISFAKGLKNLVEDIERVDHQLIINWKELASSSEGQLKNRMADVYKRIYYFIQLLQMYAKLGGGQSGQESAAASQAKAAAVAQAAEIDDTELDA